jgi:hypothetical protein
MRCLKYGVLVAFWAFLTLEAVLASDFSSSTVASSRVVRNGVFNPSFHIWWPNSSRQSSTVPSTEISCLMSASRMFFLDSYAAAMSWTLRFVTFQNFSITGTDLKPGLPGFVGSVNDLSSPRRARYCHALVDPLVHSLIGEATSCGIASNCGDDILLLAPQVSLPMLLSLVCSTSYSQSIGARNYLGG